MRRIVSLWVPHFHAVVETLLAPRLGGRPLVVVSGHYAAGRVVGVSPEAAAQGAEPGMSWRHARLRCPDAVLLKYERARYVPVVEQLGSLLSRFTPWAELFPEAEDELFADLGRGAAAEGLEMARRIRRQCAEELGLPLRLGLATGKLAARAASRLSDRTALRHPGSRRAGEAGLVLVPEGRERAFLAPLPVETLWDLKPEAVRRLHLLGLRTLGQVAALPPRVLVSPLGAAALWYSRLARGLDRRPVADWVPSPAETAACFVEPEMPEREDLDRMLAGLASRIADRLCHAGRYGRVVSLTMHLAGGRRLSAARYLKEPTHLARSLVGAAGALLDLLEPRLAEPMAGADPEGGVGHVCASGPGTAGCEALELSVAGLETGGVVQLSLLGDEDRTPALRAALARVRERFGERALARGSEILEPPVR